MIEATSPEVNVVVYVAVEPVYGSDASLISVEPEYKRISDVCEPTAVKYPSTLNENDVRAAIGANRQRRFDCVPVIAGESTPVDEFESPNASPSVEDPPTTDQPESPVPARAGRVVIVVAVDGTRTSTVPDVDAPPLSVAVY